VKNISLLVFTLPLLFLVTCLVSNSGQPVMPTLAPQANSAFAVGTMATVAKPTVTPTPQLVAKTYYVSTVGSDLNTGTKTLPFRTISKAAKVARAGDVVNIQAGVYNEMVKPMFSGVPGRYITYKNAGDGEVIIDAQSGKRPAGIVITNLSYLIFSNLTVRGANLYDIWPRSGVAVLDGSHHIILDGITSYDNYFGIMAYGREKPVSFITVRNCKTYNPDNNLGNVHYGIFFYKRVYDSIISRNHVAYTLPEEQSYGIEVSTDYPGDQTYGPRRIVISENEVDHNESQGIHTWNAVGVLISGNYLHDNGATGIQIEDGSENIIVEKNRSENNAQKYEFETGVWIDHSKNVVVRNNSLSKNKIGLTITYSDRVIVRNNVIYLNNRGADNLVNAAGLIVDDGANNISITNNTFYKNGVVGMQRGAVNFGAFHASCANINFKNNIISDTANNLVLIQVSCSNFASDYNDFFSSSPMIIRWDNQKLNWKTYRTVSKQDVHSLTNAPLFVNSQTSNFALQPLSPLKGKGTVLAHTAGAGSGRSVVVTDASYFCDGFGVGRGDLLTIGANLVVITSINYQTNTINIDREISWNKNEPVRFRNEANPPDMGAGFLP
jgi:parallel beta-helix repeat protein